MEKSKKKKLVTVRTYAINNNISTAWVYKLAEKGKIIIEEIDGVKFVIV